MHTLLNTNKKTCQTRPLLLEKLQITVGILKNVGMDPLETIGLSLYNNLVT